MEKLESLVKEIVDIVGEMKVSDFGEDYKSRVTKYLYYVSKMFLTKEPKECCDCVGLCVNKKASEKKSQPKKTVAKKSEKKK